MTGSGDEGTVGFEISSRCSSSFETWLPLSVLVGVSVFSTVWSVLSFIDTDSFVLSGTLFGLDNELLLSENICLSFDFAVSSFSFTGTVSSAFSSLETRS